MNSNRHVLRATQNQNRLPLKDVSSEKQFLSSKPRFSDQQQENCFLKNSRPILTATRSIKKFFKQTPTATSQKTDEHFNFQVTTVTNENKTRQQLEDELYELPDYRQTIFDHLKSVEHIYAPKVNFMEHQSDINAAMRTILIDWLIEVADEYKLNDETLFLCVQYVDRFLSTVNVTRSKLQLLGTTCMYVASKYEEMYPPALEEFSFITDNTYETKHILRMEQIIMKMLNFSISGPTCYTFMQYYLLIFKPEPINDDYKCLTLLSNYLCTLALLQDRPFSSYRSSMLAACCVFYANRLLNIHFNMNQLGNYHERDFNECLVALNELYQKTFQQDQASSSILRRFLKNTKENYQYRVRKLIHQSANTINEVVVEEEEEHEELFDLTLDEFDDENMSMEHH